MNISLSKSYGLTKIIINRNNYSDKTAILYPFHPYLIDQFAPTVSLAPVEVSNVESPRRRGPRIIYATGRYLCCYLHVLLRVMLLVPLLVSLIVLLLVMLLVLLFALL